MSKGISLADMYLFYQIWMTKSDAKKAAEKYIEQQRKFYGEKK
jgi:hypothetical protein